MKCSDCGKYHATNQCPECLSYYCDQCAEMMDDTCTNCAPHLVERKITAANTGSHATAPIVVCLCGSTRFFKEFMLANYQETMAGRIVLSVGFYPHSSEQAHGEHIGITAADKITLDNLHKRKIDLADEVYILNVGGYIGESTRREIDYAVAHEKPVRYLEPQRAGA